MIYPVGRMYWPQFSSCGSAPALRRGDVAAFIGSNIGPRTLILLNAVHMVAGHMNRSAHLRGFSCFVHHKAEAWFVLLELPDPLLARSEHFD